jgi:hypothetical protein
MRRHVGYLRACVVVVRERMRENTRRDQASSVGFGRRQGARRNYHEDTAFTAKVSTLIFNIRVESITR